MIITQDGIILFKTPAGIYNDCPNQATFDSMKSVYDDDMNLIYTKTNLILEWETADINWFAGQHIEKYYPIWKQNNVTREGGAAATTMSTFIDAVRAWSNTESLPNPWDGSLEGITP
jgi:hypothetical protein|tara:strand:- start:46 stop:396 length:351 start_codon:yes stop_codon:yes gene_type:complete